MLSELLVTTNSSPGNDSRSIKLRSEPSEQGNRDGGPGSEVKQEIEATWPIITSDCDSGADVLIGLKFIMKSR